MQTNWNEKRCINQIEGVGKRCRLQSLVVFVVIFKQFE